MDEWLGKHKNVPTSESWLNQGEAWFSTLPRHTLKGSSFEGTGFLLKAIKSYVNDHNKHPKPFKWKKIDAKG